MKMTPVVAGAVASAPTPTNQGVSTDRKAAAKAAFLGEAHMEKSDTPTDPLTETRERNIRTIKMTTNASPDRPIDLSAANTEAPSQESTTESGAQSRISDINEETQDGEVQKPLSPQFAALAKQKRALQVKESEIRQREEALKAREADGTSGGRSSFITEVKSNPLAILREAGVSYDELTEAVLADQSGVTPEIQSLLHKQQEKIEALENQLNKGFTERDEFAVRQTLHEIKKETSRLINSGDDFELIRDMGAVDDVVSLIHENYKRTGEVMDTDEACKLIENELMLEGEKIIKAKKLQAKFAPQTQTQPAVMPRQMRTLTARDNASMPAGRRERALAAFYGTLKR